MCYMNCQYEDYNGECTKDMPKPFDGECQQEIIDIEEEDL